MPEGYGEEDQRGDSVTDRDKGVIWDLDGVLADTGEAHYQAWAAVLSEHAIPFSG